jgi:aspartate-semialdehyde dehydrogenase
VGREIRDLLASTQMQTRLIGAEEMEAGTLTEERGEPAIMTALDEQNLAGARVAFLAGSPDSSRKALEIVTRIKPAPALIDTTYVLEDRPGALLRAPIAEPPNYTATPLSEHVIAHPAAIVLAMFLQKLNEIRPVHRTIVNVFEPASERGRRGVEELERQTVNLLTFKPLPKQVYDEQVGFNMLARYGSEAPEPLQAFEMRIERHLATLLGLAGHIGMPSLRLIQAPVFHGHSFSVWVEFDENPGRELLEAALASAQIDVRGPEVEAPTNVGMAGQGGLAVGAIETDRNNPRASWFWIVADNVRITAENAVAVAQSLIGQPGTARPQ